MRTETIRETIPLQQGVIYGPVQSRRLGLSLGLNICPDEIKVCSLNCRYCQYSWTGMLSARPEMFARFLPSREEVRLALEAQLQELKQAGTPPDTLTFSGNGEATIHPEFPFIVEDVVKLRDRYAPDCRTAILSNSTTVHREEIRNILRLLDDPILKLDVGCEETFIKLNGPARGVRFRDIVEGLTLMNGDAVLQALFVTGRVDNTTEEEVDAWLALVKDINPRQVQIYTLDRGPADRDLRPVLKTVLETIARRVRRATGSEAHVFA
jgi:wyosine [tRNA(Phe)-imidazoG37] synthetase (radical SAM superfamily)